VLGVGSGARSVAAALDGLTGPQPVALVEDPHRPEGRMAVARFARRLASTRLERLPARRCGTESRRRDIYREALDLLAAHDGKLRLDEAAAELYVSRRQLQRVFAESGATTFTEVRRRLR
jgi:AraC-like DNA-binding protein